MRILAIGNSNKKKRQLWNEKNINKTGINTGPKNRQMLKPGWKKSKNKGAEGCARLLK
jgi:hypothetical protein